MAFKPIEILINAKDNASSVFTSLQAKVIAVGGAIATYFGIRAFAGVVEGAADFEQAMSRVKAATGASAEEMARLRKTAEDAGANTKYTSTEAAAALENLAKAGLNANDAIATLPAVLSLAQAGDIELATASEFVTKAVMGLGLAFTDAGRVADVLALGANATNTSVTGLAQALSYAAPIAQSLGLSLESTVAIIGKFADAGIDASRAGTALNSILSQFADPASKFRNELAAAGITTGNFETALHQLAVAGPAGSKAINAVGQEAGPALRALLNQGMGALDELTGKLKNAEGSAAATAKVMQDNLNGSLTGLASAWDTVKNALATPLLPVLKDGVDQLAGAFRDAVKDGTVTKFGESIATAFKTGIQFVRDFISTVDFAVVVQRLQEFAQSANENLTKVGEYATNAGNIVKVAYGVMAGGANAVMTAIYGIAASYTEAAIRIVDFAARASDALAKISIGSAKKELQQQAEDMRGVLVGLSGVRDAFIEKTLQSLDATASSAQTAREGFSGLAASVNSTGAATQAWSQTVAAANAELVKGAEAAAAAGVAYQKKAQAELTARQATDDHRAALAQLRSEYAALVANGDLQAAAVKLGEINKAMAGTAPAAKEAAKAAADAAEQISSAFGRLGVTSSASLEKQAAAAKRDYETIKNAGTSTAEDIGSAFKKAAEDAIAANKGVAPSWVEAEAAARGYRVVVDDCGKATLELANKTGSTTDRMTRGWHQSREAIQANTDAMDELNMRYKLSADYTERQIALLERQAAAAEKAAEARRKALNVDKDGFTLDANGQRQQMSVANGDFVFQSAKGAGLSEADALALMDKYFQNGRPTGVAEANGLNGPSRDWFSVVNAAISKAVIEQARKNAASPPSANGGGTTAAPAGGTSTQSGMVTKTIVINLNGVSTTVNTDDAGESAVNSLIRQLTAARGTSSIR